MINNENFQVIIIILSIVLVLSYYALFTIVYLKKSQNNIFLKKMYFAVISTYDMCIKEEIPIGECFNLLELDYDKLNQNFPNNSYSSVLEVIENLIHYYDTDSCATFRKRFGDNKNQEIKIFLIEMLKFINYAYPFISVSEKDSELLNSIRNALKSNNKELGLQNLMQLSREIEAKNKNYLKKEKESKVSSIISIIGVVLTIFFGIISFVQIIH